MDKGQGGTRGKVPETDERRQGKQYLRQETKKKRYDVIKERKEKDKTGGRIADEEKANEGETKRMERTIVNEE